MGSKNGDIKEKTKKKSNPTKDSVADNEDNSHREGGLKIIADPRFASVHSDPRFQNVPKRKSKVPIDSRFASMFTDRNFAAGSAPSDKRGKPKKHRAENSLRRFYSIGEDDEDASEEAGKEKKVVSDEEESEKEVEEESDREEIGILDIESAGSESTSGLEASESDDAESTTDEEDEEVIYEDDQHEVEVENIPTIQDGTRRLAAVNMDWRHVRAVDLYVVLSSFLPKSGEILSVAVYPSEFGLQQMKEEEIHGPVGLFDDENNNNSNNNSDDDDGIDEEKLRAYEKSRMSYYYAVVECNTVATAEHLYKACDGVEFERSSNVLDLRFIPDSMEFKHPPRDVATEAPGSYEGLDFHTKVLQHSNIPISWDEDEPQRARTLQRKFNADQLANLELKEFLASDASESDEDESENDEGAEDESNKKLKKREKYRALIESGDGSSGEGEEEAQDMEITFNTGLEGLSKRILEKRDKKAETVWEEHLRKQREKKRARKKKSERSSDDDSSDDDEEILAEPGDFFVEEPLAKKAKHDSRDKNNKEEKLRGKDEAEASRAELELLLADDDGVDNGLKGYNLKQKKSKGKKGKEVPDENKIPAVNYEDPRFSALFTSSLFALDPTDPQFKRSATYARQMVQKQQKSDSHIVEREHEKPPPKSQLSSNKPDMDKKELVDSDFNSSKREKYEISSLVKSIKMKSNQVKLPSKGKSKKDEKFKTM